jgi:hypothetical protein
MSQNNVILTNMERWLLTNEELIVREREFDVAYTGFCRIK